MNKLNVKIDHVNNDIREIRSIVHEMNTTLEVFTAVEKLFDFRGQFKSSESLDRKEK